MTLAEKFDAVLKSFINDDSKHRSFTISGLHKVVNHGYVFTDFPIDENQVRGLVLELRSKGFLVDDNNAVLSNRVFYISPTGMELINNGGYRLYADKLSEKAELEQKVLKATDQSFTLNIIQLIITFFLAVGTIAALVIQFRMYQSDIEKNRLEIEKLKIEIDQLTPPQN